MRILITGSRQWTDRRELEDVLWVQWLSSNGNLTIVHGDCPRGADRMVREWCERENARAVEELGGPLFTEERHPADWDQYGKAAGFIRNQEMVSLGADLCIAFVVPGKSKGTQHTIDLARKAGIPVEEVFQDG